MSQRTVWMTAVLGGLAAGGAALWWMFGGDGPFTSGVNDRRSAQPLVDESLTPLTRPAPPPSDYAGSQSCRECHRDLWERYQTHPMSHSMFLAAETSPPEDFERGTTFTAGRHEYRVERSDAGIRHHEIARDAAGEVIYDQAVDIQYAVGSAKRGRSYFIDRGGLLFMSPISWYSEQGQGRWDLSPNYDPAGHLRFERRIGDACVSCHVGAARPRPQSADRFYSPPFSELSIGCERCHGPGERHVELRRSEGPAAQADSIVNPARLDASRRDAVCYQCHLLGKERVLQYGRTDFDFRPGMYLGDVWAVLVEGTGVADDESTEAVSQAEQMLASRCYQASQGKLGCISCHDPHYSPAPTERLDFYRTRCLACHSQRGCSESLEVRQQADKDSCVACHTPRLSANDVPHTSQTDHRILRRKVPGKSSTKLPPDPDRIRLFEAGTPGLPSRTERRARGILLSMLAERQQDVRMAVGVERSLEPLVQAAPDDAAVLDALAVAAAVQRRTADATARWNALLAISPRNESALQSLALQSIAAGRRPDAVMYLERYLIVNPWNSELHAKRSRLLAQLGIEAESISEARKALELDPSRAEIYDWLSTLCARAGFENESQRYKDLLRRIEQQPPK